MCSLSRCPCGGSLSERRTAEESAPLQCTNEHACGLTVAARVGHTGHSGNMAAATCVCSFKFSPCKHFAPKPSGSINHFKRSLGGFSSSVSLSQEVPAEGSFSETALEAPAMSSLSHRGQVHSPEKPWEVGVRNTHPGPSARLAVQPGSLPAL